MNDSIVLGVDIGGTHITSALVNSKTGSVVPNSSFRTSINAQGNKQDIIAGWAANIQRSWQSAGYTSTAIGMAMPGPFDYQNGISLICEQDKYQALYKQDIGELLGSALLVPKTNFRFINDACAFLKGEMAAGNVQELNKAMGITLGTGLGAAYCRNGVLVDADLWKMPFKSGKAESYLSTGWFVAECRERFGKNVKGVKELLGDGVVSAGSLKFIFESFAENLALFLRQVYGLFRCDTIIIGGNITKAAAYFWDSVSKWLKQLNCPAKISLTQLGEDSAIIGAASMFWHEEVEKKSKLL